MADDYRGKDHEAVVRDLLMKYHEVTFATNANESDVLAASGSFMMSVHASIIVRMQERGVPAHVQEELKHWVITLAARVQALGEAIGKPPEEFSKIVQLLGDEVHVRRGGKSEGVVTTAEGTH
jgi:hypothetical protein